MINDIYQDVGMALMHEWLCASYTEFTLHAVFDRSVENRGEMSAAQ
jgi:hypothetical protein